MKEERKVGTDGRWGKGNKGRKEGRKDGTFFPAHKVSILPRKAITSKEGRKEGGRKEGRRKDKVREGTGRKEERKEGIEEGKKE